MEICAPWAVYGIPPTTLSVCMSYWKVFGELWFFSVTFENECTTKVPFYLQILNFSLNICSITNFFPLVHPFYASLLTITIYYFMYYFASTISYIINKECYASCRFEINIRIWEFSIKFFFLWNSLFKSDKTVL